MPIPHDMAKLIEERDTYRDGFNKLYVENLRLNLRLKEAMVEFDVRRQAKVIDAAGVERT
jgi:hypothetical protein